MHRVKSFAAKPGAVMTSTNQPLLEQIAADLQTLVAAHQAGSQSPWLTVTGAAAYASVSPKSIERLLAAGKLQRHTPIGGRVLVSRAELDSLIRSATASRRTGRGKNRGSGGD